MSPDPLPDHPEKHCSAYRPGTWVYARGQYELALLHRLVRECSEVNRFVDYVPNYGQLVDSAYFRCAWSAEGAVSLTSPGKLTVGVDGQTVGVKQLPSGWHRADISPDEGSLVEVHVAGPAGSPATFALAHPTVPGSAWSSSADGSRWAPTQLRRGSLDVPAHADREPTVQLPAHRIGDAFQLATPVLGRPLVSGGDVEQICVGESRPEALDFHGEHESRHDHLRLPDGRWTTEHELGFQFLSIRGSDLTEVSVDAAAHPVDRRGAFLCSDDRLSRIWAHSAYTLRLCMHDLMIDGIKRDRLPWAGDQALTTLANAYSFADAVIARDSIVALGQPRYGYVNGIADYSLWWLINNALYARYFGDRDHVRREAAATYAFVTRLIDQSTGPEELFRPVRHPDSFVPENGSVFIDWGVKVDQGRVLTALQMLWYWALRSAADFLSVVDHPGVPRLTEMADRLRVLLRKEAWDPTVRAWREYFGESSTDSPYPNTLAMLCGLSTEPTDGVVAALRTAAGLSTPFMSSFALRAMVLAGDVPEVISIIRTRWGAMLETGATTFWEEFEHAPEKRYSMYDRPYGMSMCHAWASGPAAILPEAILGLHPLSSGWATFTVCPRLGDLEWAAAAVPVPGGEIVVVATGQQVSVDVPFGSALVHGGENVPGPAHLTWPNSAGQQEPDLPRTSTWPST